MADPISYDIFTDRNGHQSHFNDQLFLREELNFESALDPNTFLHNSQWGSLITSGHSPVTPGGEVAALHLGLESINPSYLAEPSTSCSLVSSGSASELLALSGMSLQTPQRPRIASASSSTNMSLGQPYLPNSRLQHEFSRPVSPPQEMQVHVMASPKMPYEITGLRSNKFSKRLVNALVAPIKRVTGRMSKSPSPAVAPLPPSNDQLSGSGGQNQASIRPTPSSTPALGSVSLSIDTQSSRSAVHLAGNGHGNGLYPTNQLSPPASAQHIKSRASTTSLHSATAPTTITENYIDVGAPQLESLQEEINSSTDSVQPLSIKARQSYSNLVIKKQQRAIRRHQSENNLAGKFLLPHSIHRQSPSQYSDLDGFQARRIVQKRSTGNLHAPRLRVSSSSNLRDYPHARSISNLNDPSFQNSTMSSATGSLQSAMHQRQSSDQATLFHDSLDLFNPFPPNPILESSGSSGYPHNGYSMLMDQNSYIDDYMSTMNYEGYHDQSLNFQTAASDSSMEPRTTENPSTFNPESFSSGSGDGLMSSFQQSITTPLVPSNEIRSNHTDQQNLMTQLNSYNLSTNSEEMLRRASQATSSSAAVPHSPSSKDTPSPPVVNGTAYMMSSTGFQRMEDLSGSPGHHMPLLNSATPGSYLNTFMMNQQPTTHPVPASNYSTTNSRCGRGSMVATPRKTSAPHTRRSSATTLSQSRGSVTKTTKKKPAPPPPKAVFHGGLTFVNAGVNDSEFLMTAVAPSGSHLTKQRRDQEARYIKELERREWVADILQKGGQIPPDMNKPHCEVPGEYVAKWVAKKEGKQEPKKEKKR